MSIRLRRTSDKEGDGEIMSMLTNENPSMTGHPRRISRAAHGLIDYGIGIMLIVAPKLFQFGDQNIAASISVAIGIMTIFYSLLTDYEMGVVRMIPYAGHRLFDFVAGVALLGSPVHFNVTGRAAVVLFVAGAVQIASLFLTRRPRNEAASG
jgi:hypothetical protein